MALKEVTVTFTAEIGYTVVIDESDIIVFDEAVQRRQASLIKEAVDADIVNVTNMKQFVRDFEEDET